MAAHCISPCRCAPLAAARVTGQMQSCLDHGCGQAISMVGGAGLNRRPSCSCMRRRRALNWNPLHWAALCTLAGCVCLQRKADNAMRKAHRLLLEALCSTTLSGSMVQTSSPGSCHGPYRKDCCAPGSHATWPASAAGCMLKLQHGRTTGQSVYTPST